MKYLIILNSNKYRYHIDFLKLFTEIVQESEKSESEKSIVRSIDFSDSIPLHEKYFAIENEKANLIINLDLAGFELKTESGTLSLNAIPCRIVNILFRDTDNYVDDLQYRQNLSMFTYFSKETISGSDDTLFLHKQFDEIPNPMFFCKYNCRAKTDAEISANKKNVIIWIQQMIDEVHL